MHDAKKKAVNFFGLGHHDWFSRSRYILKCNKKLSIHMKRLHNTVNDGSAGVEFFLRQLASSFVLLIRVHDGLFTFKPQLPTWNLFSEKEPSQVK